MGTHQRLELGQDSVQGIDYAYTINGWLKGINMPSLQPDHDPGGDGAETQAPYSDNYTDTIPLMGYVSSRTLGAKQYELTDHLGNVRATVSDIVIKHYTNLDAELSTRTDYYPFGMIMGGRSSSVDNSHRYGFNGKENDNEVKGEGVQQDYGFRIYDARVGRFLSVDPRASSFAAWSPYHQSGNSPISLIDEVGLDWIVSFEGGNDPRKYFNALITATFSGRVQAQIDESQKVTLEFVGNHSYATLDAFQQALYNTLQKVIQSTEGDLKQRVVAGMDDITIDLYATKSDLLPVIDVHDIVKVGVLMGDYKYSAAFLGHAVAEHFNSALHGIDYDRDHQIGVEVENRILGMTRLGTPPKGVVEVSKEGSTETSIVSGKVYFPYVANGQTMTLEVGISNGLVKSASLQKGNTLPSHDNKKTTPKEEPSEEPSEESPKVPK